MSSNFTTTLLAGGAGVLVEGTDVRGVKGQEVLNGAYWEGVRAKATAESAVKLVDDAIAALVAPVTAAIEQANAILTKPALDPLFYVVEGEDVEHVVAQKAEIVRLDRDSVILRALEEGQGDRLIWVNDKLTVTAAAPAPVQAFAGDDAV